MNRTMLPYWLSLIVLLVGGLGGWEWYQDKQMETAGALEEVAFQGPPLTEFELTERSGQPFHSADMKGKVWVASFFFATCAGQCPRLNANIKHLHNLPELADVTFVSITVDPDNDTLPVLQEYAERFRADPQRWLFCRGDFNYIKRIGADIFDMEVSWKGHKDLGIVIDRTGKIRGRYDVTSNSQTEKLRQLLVECLAEEIDNEESVQAPTTHEVD